ncbi:MAG: phosphatase PAP2 family protein [Gemmatimonadaceae bacterium]
MRRSTLDNILVAATATAIAVVLGAATQTFRTAAFDRKVRKAMRARRPRVVRLARSTSYLAAPASHPALAIAASAALTAARGRLAPAPVLASLLALAIDRGARLFVDQLRPPGARRRTGLERFGFPSGHTSAGTAIAFATAMEFAKGRSPGEKAATYLSAGIFAAAVGWSRVALDEHWADDVMGGWAVGVAIASIADLTCDLWSLAPAEMIEPGL